MTQEPDLTKSTGRFVQTKDLRIYLEESGRGESIIFLHGSMGTGEDWRPYIPALSNRFRLLLPDTRGHGKTENPGGQITTLQGADDMAAVLQALDIDQAFFCGWSGGGDISLNIAQRYPEKVKGLIIGGVTLRLSPTYRQTLQAMGLDGPGIINFDRAEQAIPELVSLWQSRHTQSPTHWKDLLLQVSPEMWSPRVPSPESLKIITAPALIIWGDRDQFLPVEDAVELYHLLPNAALSIIPYADHFVTRTHPAEVAATIEAFLGRGL